MENTMIKTHKSIKDAIMIKSGKKDWPASYTVSPASFLLLFSKNIIRIVEKMPPMYPTRLIIALPFERSGFGVTSGIYATAGVRYVDMVKRSKNKTMRNGSILDVEVKMPSKTRRIAEMIVPNKIYGVLFPRGDLVLSERAPNKGSMKIARMLSMDIMEFACKVEREKVFSKM
jgi:hypothetical protein